MAQTSAGVDATRKEEEKKTETDRRNPRRNRRVKFGRRKVGRKRRMATGNWKMSEMLRNQYIHTL
jgi:hypothetical protein